MTLPRRLKRFIATVLVLIGVFAAGLLFRYLTDDTIKITAAVPEADGFQPDYVRVPLGEPVTLRFKAEDVAHGVAIGPGLGVDLGRIEAGESAEITLTFDQAGIYTYYCNTWCSTEHWRMRGVLEIYDPADPDRLPPPEPDPIIEALIAEGVDIDAAVHEEAEANHAPAITFELPPSGERGAAIMTTLAIPRQVQDPAWQQSHTPLDALEALSALNPDASRRDLLDVVAYLWAGDVPSVPEIDVAYLYDANCADCHGQQGYGDGVGAKFTAEKPTPFADLSYMFEMRSDILYAKIRRGGMGTDMPNFGTIFTREETWALVEYIWGLSFSGESYAPPVEESDS